MSVCSEFINILVDDWQKPGFRFGWVKFHTAKNAPIRPAFIFPKSWSKEDKAFGQYITLEGDLSDIKQGRKIR